MYLTYGSYEAAEEQLTRDGYIKDNYDPLYPYAHTGGNRFARIVWDEDQQRYRIFVRF